MNATTLFSLALTVLGVPILGAYFFQNWLIYHPSRYPEAALEALSERSGLTPWPAADKHYRGFLRAPEGQPKGTVVIFHGNAGAAIDRVYYANALVPLGYRVILNEYPGFGARTGAHNEDSLVSDARATVRMVMKEFGDPVIIWGESLGCAVATAVSTEVGGRVGIVLLTPWLNLPELAQTIYWFLPAKWLVKDTFDNVRNLAGFRGPVAVLLADRDEIIPNEQTLALYNAISGPKRLWTFRNAGHNSWPASPREDWWREVMDYVGGGPSLPAVAPE